MSTVGFARVRDPLANVRAEELRARKQENYSGRVVLTSKDKQHKKDLTSIDDDLKRLGLNTNYSGTDELATNTETFDKRFFDALYAFGRRHANIQVGDKKLDKWYDKFGPNYKQLKGEFRKLMKLPEGKKRKMLNALKMAYVFSPIDTKDYTKSVENMLQNKLDPETFIKDQTKVAETLGKNFDRTDQFPLAKPARNLVDLALLSEKDYVKYLGDKMSPEETEKFGKDIDRLTKITTTEPDPNKPRVFLYYSSREGKMGDYGDPNGSFANSDLTYKLQKHWENKGCDVIELDGSGSSTGKAINYEKLLKK